MARICGFHGVSVVKNLLGKASRQSTSLCFRYVSHGGHIAHEQARIEAEATNGSGRKHSLYKGLGVRHRAIHEINGACPSLPAARNPNPLIHGNSTWNVEEPFLYRREEFRMSPKLAYPRFGHGPVEATVSFCREVAGHGRSP
jgi:hypothetical protein